MITRAIAMAAMLMASASLEMAQQASIYRWTLWNNTRSDIDEVYMVNSGSRNWGTELLEHNHASLDSGKTFYFDRRVGEYDLKLVTERGAVCEMKHIQITRTTTFELTPERLSACIRNTPQ